jgi:hypothetical protein
VSKRKPAHKVKVAKRNLYGARLWWGICTCGTKQGWDLKQDAQRFKREHEAMFTDP